MLTKQKKRRNRNGVAAAEMAVCLPFVLIMVLGAVEVSSGLHQQHRLRATAHECAKIAAKSTSSMSDVLATANELITIDGITDVQIDITVMPRTTNLSTVETPSTTTFTIDQTGSGTPGLEDVPRGTVLQIVVTVPRPPIPGLGFAENFLNRSIVAQCVFVKEI